MDRKDKIPMLNQALMLARHYWGYSQSELASLLGVSQAMVSDIESGKKGVSMEMLDNYSKVLGIKKSQLMFFAEEIEGEPTIRRGRLIVAQKALDILSRLKPNET